MSLPVELDRDEARQLAERELGNPRYTTEPPVHERMIEWVGERLARLLDGAAGALNTPVATVALIVVIALLVLLILRYSPVARRGARGRPSPVFGPVRRTAAEHRASADQAAAREDWSTAVVERFRAITAGLEERAVLEPRLGRTADEVARDAGRPLPEEAERLTTAARLFDRVYYGRLAAERSGDDELRSLDDAIRSARPRFETVTT